MLTRRELLRTSLATSCAGCAALTATPLFAAGEPEFSAPSKIQGPGYLLSYLGSQSQTILTGDRAAHLELRTLQGRPHLYGVGPIQGLTGEVTIADSRPSLARVGADHLVHVAESYAVGVPFFVWAEVSAWQTQKTPGALQSYTEVEKFVGEAGAKAGLSQAFPFVISGRAQRVDFHIVDALPDTPPGMAAHRQIQIPFELHGERVRLVGFWSSRHQGIFTPMGTNMHVHFQTLDNTVSGHVQGLSLASGMTLDIPKG